MTANFFGIARCTVGRVVEGICTLISENIGPLFIDSEAVVRRCSVKKVFLEILQNSQEDTCARVSF